MVAIPLDEVLLGVYLGLLAGIFPAFIAFALGFAFKYFTNVTIPGLGVVAFSGAIAGISGGLMGLLDPQIAESWIGITAVVVILMLSLWAHSIGDKLGAETPRHLTLQRLRNSRLSADLVERVDGYGQLRVRPIGGVQDIEGYPPLPENLHERIATRTWKFPASLPLTELEDRLEQQLLDEFELAEAMITIDRRGRARIAAAPTAAGLSRRIPSGNRAVTIETLLPTGIARGDEVELTLEDGTAQGRVMSARTTDAPATTPVVEDGALESVDRPATDGHADDVKEDDETPPAPKAPTTTGGTGRVTVALPPADAVRVLRQDFAPVVVHSRGKRREYEAISVLKSGGNRFRKLTLREGSPVVGETIGSARIGETHAVVILSIRRTGEQHVAPTGSMTLATGDELIVAGKPAHLRRFAEVAT